MDAPPLLISQTIPFDPQRDQVLVTPENGGRGQLAAATGILYTAPIAKTAGAASGKAKLTEIILSNFSGSGARNVTIYIVESGGTANAARAILQGPLIADGETWVLAFNTALEDGETIQGKADAANLVTYRISVERRQAT